MYIVNIYRAKFVSRDKIRLLFKPKFRNVGVAEDGVPTFFD